MLLVPLKNHLIRWHDSECFLCALSQPMESIFVIKRALERGRQLLSHRGSLSQRWIYRADEHLEAVEGRVAPHKRGNVVRLIRSLISPYQ